VRQTQTPLTLNCNSLYRNSAASRSNDLSSWPMLLSCGIPHGPRKHGISCVIGRSTKALLVQQEFEQQFKRETTNDFPKRNRTVGALHVKRQGNTQRLEKRTRKNRIEMLTAGPDPFTSAAVTICFQASSPSSLYLLRLLSCKPYHCRDTLVPHRVYAVESIESAWLPCVSPSSAMRKLSSK
jgi:hypothetical protein